MVCRFIIHRRQFKDEWQEGDDEREAHRMLLTSIINFTSNLPWRSAKEFAPS